ncbi:pentapeptide repeat-containing protein [Hyalangium versicolor]|uniref:pentapeptide repeat-containing protein n=1 Tax=Hyalangium versicolor TaxID=2861190 RepID=UPI001CCA8530|nr:pentapeptide repeat-containing protein [Hyalangium versicolor]
MHSDYPDNLIIEERTLEGERLELGAKNIRYYLGPNLVLKRCTLVIRVSSERFHLAGPRFIDCHIELKRQLKDAVWYTAHLKGCRFTGRLFSCDFGHQPDYGVVYQDVGGIEDCDFTAAHLHACRFVGCDASTLKFPRWPYFTILDPYRRREEFASITWRREIRSWFTSFDMYPEETAAITFSATALAKDAGVSEDRIRALLESHADVIY